MPSVARLGAPLNQKLKNGQPAHFSGFLSNDLRAMYELKYKLVAPLNLAFWYDGRNYTLDSNAEIIQVERVFLQKQTGGTTKPLGHMYRL